MRDEAAPIIPHPSAPAPVILSSMPDTSILDPNVEASLASAGIAYETLACDPALADTAAFCEHYAIPPANACNTIVVVIKSEPRRYVACLVNATSKLDVNRKLSAIVGTKKLSFAAAEETAQLTGQMIGGVTLAALPADWPVYIDQRVMELDYAILGGGNRSSKIKVAPRELTKLPNAQVADIGIPRT
jgi:prolyl-tRNA editing enzyme YbaK/EbsC (Cys-tRNA(Pro) deacylase)